uniref:CCHC-type domain-containing protein n=1 Tax=Tanacetum cinerariifolium TaxID=118510 RepID=A0A6L2NRD7_TANCI|nr:hypothetical protein [Tanacetum cinerariifolium]
MILNSVQNGPLIWLTVVEEDGTTRTKKYEELSVVEKLQADCDLKATNIIFQGLTSDVYAIVNHHKVSKEIWDRVKLLMQGTKLLLQEKECLVVPVFNQRDDPITCLNNAIAFLTVVASSRFPSTKNQLRTSSNQINQATIQDGRVTVQKVQGRQGQSYVGNSYNRNATSSGGNNAGCHAKVVKCYNCQGEGHMARQCTQLKRPRNATWFKEKAMLAEAHEVVLMANLSNYGSDVISKKAQRIKPTLFDGSVISSQHVACHMIDDEETLILEEVSRSKMLAKQNHPMSKEKKVNTTLINYVELNRLSEDFDKCFVPQQELSNEQAFWLQTPRPNTGQYAWSPVKTEAPKELPKITLDAITEGEWGLNTPKLFF